MRAFPPRGAIVCMSMRLLSRGAHGHMRVSPLAQCARWCATASEPVRTSSSRANGDEVVVKESPIEGVYVLEMQHKAVGSACLSASLLSSFLTTIETVCDPDKGHARGLIITAPPGCAFGGDLDIDALLTDDPSPFAHYWHLFQQLFVTLHTLPVPTAAAVGGLCSTGGTTLALACDYRVMSVADAAIGIPAARDGFCVPPYVAGALERVVGFRRAESLLTLGTMLSADDATSCGLVDELVDASDEVVVPCLEHIEKTLELPSPLPYWLAKDTLRRRVLAPLCTHALRTADTANVHEMLHNPSVRSALESARRGARTA